VPATPAGPKGTAVSANGVSFVIPVGLGSDANADTVAEVMGTPDNPGWDVAPVHYKFALQGYPVAGAPLANEPTILVYPAKEYAAVNTGAANSLERLRAILAAPSAPLTREGLPSIPFFNAAQIMASNTKMIAFQGGTGVRMLVHYAQGLTPVDNQNLSYHFHGLTADGKYYVIAILPITAPFLPQDYNAPLPANGVPFPDDPAAYESYLNKIAELLTAAEKGNTLAPDIKLLDALVQSIKLSAPPIVPPAPVPTVAQPTPTPVASIPCDAAKFILICLAPTHLGQNPGCSPRQRVCPKFLTMA